MSKLSEMIARLCPNGVEYKKLGEVARIRNGRDYKHLGKGEIPVYGSGGIMTYVDSFAYDGQSVLIPRKGSLDKIYYTEGKIWTVDTIFYTEIDQSVVLPKFLYYYLQAQHIERLNTAGGVPSLTQAVLSKISIPLPPLEIQREIVQILDNFANLTAELTAELAKRKKQYEHYRRALLGGVESGGTVKSWPMVKLGEVCERVSAGGDVPDSCVKGQLAPNDDRPYPVYSNGIGENALYGYAADYKIEGEAVTIAARGTIGHHEWRKGKYTGIIRLITLQPNEMVISAKFLNYALFTVNFVFSGGGIPQLTVPMVKEVKIPLPPLAEQERIVAILDRFDSLCNSLTEGLPAEIALRKKQYEYYRDKLLSFKEAS